METSKFIIGHTYGNGKGQYRKIRRFTDTLGRDSATPLDIWYVRCNENGTVIGAGKEKNCWVSTFISWAKEHVGDVGNFED